MGWVPQSGETVIDKSGTHYVLGSEIGRGGEGTVFATQAEGAAVKIITESATSRDELENRISRVTRLPVLDLPVAVPRYVLSGSEVGYSMTLLTGMTSLNELILPSTTSPFTESWYRDTGGLKKRLLIIEALSEVIGALHARGLVYCDLSANNVLISQSLMRSKLFLIDLDNLRYSTEKPRRIWTAPFSAPEQHEKGASRYTDDFSLSILAFSILTGCNPFYGQALDEASPEDYEGLPYALNAPWIDDPSDKSNRWTACIDRKIVISPRMYGLFERSFTLGRFKPEIRSSALEFAAAARSASHAIYECEDCGWCNYVTSNSCESCGLESTNKVIRVMREFEGTLTPFEVCPIIVLDPSRPCEVKGLTLGFTDSSANPVLVVKSVADKFEIELFSDEIHFEEFPIRKRIEIKLDAPLIIGRKNRSDLVLKLEIVGGPNAN